VSRLLTPSGTAPPFIRRSTMRRSAINQSPSRPAASGTRDGRPLQPRTDGRPCRIPQEVGSFSAFRWVQAGLAVCRSSTASANRSMYDRADVVATVALGRYGIDRHVEAWRDAARCDTAQMLHGIRKPIAAAPNGVGARRRPRRGYRNTSIKPQDLHNSALAGLAHAALEQAAKRANSSGNVHAASGAAWSSALVFCSNRASSAAD